MHLPPVNPIMLFLFNDHKTGFCTKYIYIIDVWGRGWTTSFLYDGPHLGLELLVVSLCESLIWWRGIFLLISGLHSCIMHYPSFAYHFPLELIYSQKPSNLNTK